MREYFHLHFVQILKTRVNLFPNFTPHHFITHINDNDQLNLFFTCLQLQQKKNTKQLSTEGEMNSGVDI